jgi:Glucokinase
MLPSGTIKRSTRRSGRHSRVDPQARGGICTDRGIVPILGQILAQSELRACFEAKGRMRSYLAAVPIYVIVLLYPGSSAPYPCCGSVRGKRRLLSRRFLENRDHAVDDIIDHCSYWKLDFLRGVLPPGALEVFAIIKYLVKSIVFADAPH